MTFSMVAWCPETKMTGVVISTAIPAVGAFCTYGAPGVGSVATQSWTNPYLGINALKAMRSGASLGDALKNVLSGDQGRERRQVGIVDANGNCVSFTGTDCTGWSGSLQGNGWSAQGNMLTGPSTLQAMGESFTESIAHPLGDRLTKALSAGQKAGGDKRGRQSAALLIHSTEEYPRVDLRVDDHQNPTDELTRLWGITNTQILPFVNSMPRLNGDEATLSAEAKALIMQDPRSRPQ